MSKLRSPRPVVVLRTAQAAFWGAIILAFAAAVVPANDVPSLVPWDKALHFMTFYVLSILAAGAFPRRSLLILAAVLSGFGGIIELVQGIPVVHRDCDFWDWVADSIAVCAALGPVALVKWRVWLGSF